MQMIFVLLLLFILPLHGWAAPAEPVPQEGTAKDTLVAVVPEDLPPTYFKDPATGRAAGFAIDVMDEIARQAGLKVNYVFAKPWDEMVEMVLSGRADVIPHLTPSPEREKLLDFTIPIEVVPVGLTVTANSRVTGFAPGLKVVTLRGSVPEKHMRTKEPAVTVILYDEMTKVLFSLLSGEADAAFVLNPNLMKFAIDAGVEERLKVLSPPVYEAKRGIAVRKDAPGLREQLNSSAKRFIGTPEYASLFAKWYGKPQPYWTTIRTAYTLGGILLFAVMGLLYWRYLSIARLSRKVAASADALQATFDSVNDAIFIHDLTTGAILEVNRKMCEMYGYEHDEVLRLTVEDLSSGTPPYTGDEAVAWIKKAAEGVPQLFEWHARRKDGRLFWVEINMRTASIGGRDRVIVAVRDITERKWAEERLGIATQAAHIAIWDWDIVKNVLVWDDSMYALYGIRKDDFGGAYDAWSHTIHPEDKARTEGEIQAALHGEHEYAPEFRIQRPDGSIRHIKADSRTFRSQDGKPLRMVGTNIDITELKRSAEEKVRLEDQLIQAQKMEAIGTLAGGIAHDFNNILSPIVGYTELARMRAKDDPKLSEYLKQVGEAASRATNLVRQILTFSRKAETQMMPLQVSSVVKEALKLLRSSIPTTIEIRQEIATQAMVLADPTRIHQIVMNLCTNAYQSMEKTGGVLAVSLKETEVPQGKVLGEEIKPGRYVVLEVSDTGCGMDKETQAKIFEPYFTTKETGKGTGLGLAVVHGIVKDHQGMINVYSEPGQGTTFRVYLPMTEGQTHAAHAKQEEAIPTKRHEHILFVDDEERICSMAKEYMAEYGYVVDVCSNGRDALFSVEQDLKAYDLLITDMTMPGMNGKELTKKVLALRPDLPVILCTGYSSLIDREEATKIGIRAYVEKPVVMDDLLNKIREVLSGHGQRG